MGRAPCHSRAADGSDGEPAGAWGSLGERRVPVRTAGAERRAARVPDGDRPRVHCGPAVAAGAQRRDRLAPPHPVYERPVSNPVSPWTDFVATGIDVRVTGEELCPEREGIVDDQVVVIVSDDQRDVLRRRRRRNVSDGEMPATTGRPASISRRTASRLNATPEGDGETRIRRPWCRAAASG